MGVHGALVGQRETDHDRLAAAQRLETAEAARDRLGTWILGPLKRVAVYDLGGGTFDFAVVDCSGSDPCVLRSASDMFLGGDDIDAKIAEWVAGEVLKQHNWDLTNYPEVQDRLLAECERAKIRLSSWERTTLDLSQVDPELPSAAEPMTFTMSGTGRAASSGRSCSR